MTVAKTPRRDRFGQPIPTTVRGRTRVCGQCGRVIDSVEIPAGYLDDPYWGEYMCGDCSSKTRPA